MALLIEERSDTYVVSTGLNAREAVMDDHNGK